MNLRKLQNIFSLFLLISFSWLIPSFSYGEGDTTVSIRIETPSSTIFDGNVTVSNCTVTDSTEKNHEFSNTAICALDEASKEGNFSYVMEDGGFGLYLKQITSSVESPSDPSRWWSFWTNYDLSPVGIDAYQLKQNDKILLFFSNGSEAPIKITPPDNFKLETPLNFIIEKRTGTWDEQWQWHGTWEKAVNSTFHLGNKTYPVPEDGKVTLTFSEPLSENYWATGEGLVKSDNGKMVIESEISPTPSASPSPAPTPSPTPTSSPTSTPTPFPITSGTISDETLKDSAEKGLSFLKSKQDQSGSIDGYVTTAWAIMAFGANNDRATTITNGLSLLDALKKSEVESATDIERMILAIRASGNNPKSFDGKNYIKLLLMKYRDNQFGDTNLINDDIFGVLAMLSADENVNRSEIKNSVSTIISKQKDDGAFENLDLTAAAIQALKAYQSKEGSIPVDNSLNKAKAYLREHQDSFGGFGENSASTSWAIQALLSLGENLNDWKVGDSSPWSALLRFQNSDGGFSWKSPGSSSAFMTAYAIPALLKTFWPINKLEMETTPMETSSPVPTTETQSTAAPSPPVSSPTIAGMATSKTFPKSKPVNSPTESPKNNISESESILEPRQIPNSQNNQSSNTVIALFTVSNVGIGVLFQRILAKLFV